MCMEAEECVCSARCEGDGDHCAGGEDMRDECICIAVCKGKREPCLYPGEE